MPARPTSTEDKLAKIRNRLKTVDTSKGGGGAGFWSPKEGRNTIRVLPEVATMEFFFQTVGRHELPGQNKPTFVYCPAFTSEGELPCPICEIEKQLWEAGDKQMAAQLRVRRMFWMNIIDRDDEAAGPKIYTPGVTVFDSIVSIVNDPDFGDITDIAEGFDLVLEREGKGLETQYQVRARPKRTPLSADRATAQVWLKVARDLSWVEVSDDPSEDKALADGHAVFLLPYNRIVTEFELDGLQDAPAPATKKLAVVPAKPAKKQRLPEPEEDVEDEDADDEDYDVPVTRARRR